MGDGAVTDLKRPTVMDTDIGSDVDDLVALAVLASAPEVHLVGVTTVYGDTVLRARIARWACDRLGKPDVAVMPGRQETLTGRPVWWPGHEGVGLTDLDQVQVAPEPAAVDYLCQMARAYPGQLDLLAVGPLTNVAAALGTDAAFATNLRHLYVMGGAFWPARAEHNFRCDPEAAALVMDSGIPMSICGLDVTTQVWLSEPDLAIIEASNHPLAADLSDQVRRWWVVREREQDNPHDALAALMLVRPELFQFTSCDVTINQDDPHPGLSRAVACGQGQIQIASAVDRDAAKQELLRRLTHLA